MKDLEFKGTKGKWVERYSNGTTQIKKDKRLICEVYHNFEINNDDESEYNAKLIASAPDLLEALQEVRKHMNAYIPEKVFDLVDKAIEKALK